MSRRSAGCLGPSPPAAVLEHMDLSTSQAHQPRPRIDYRGSQFGQRIRRRPRDQAACAGHHHRRRRCATIARCGRPGQARLSRLYQGSRRIRWNASDLVEMVCERQPTHVSGRARYLGTRPRAFDRFEREPPRMHISWFGEALELANWDHIPAGFIQTSAIYDHAAAEAGRRGWPVTKLHGTHLHPILHPAEMASAILSMSHRLDPGGGIVSAPE
jgi:hypothetical protein